MSAIATFDPEIAKVIENEQRRQRDQLVMIASENYTSAAVLETGGSVLTNKYAEGYPGRRYYAGCENVDVSEQLAIDRAKELFGAEHANVQPHSGSQANMAAFFALANPGDRIMAMSLDHGGHLTHGSPVNFSGKLYEFGHYGVDPDTESLNYDTLQQQAEEFKPAIIIAGYTAYPMAIDFKRFREIADAVGAYLLVDMAHIAGLIAGGAHPSPVEYADIVTSTTHKTLRGPRGAMALTKKEFRRKYNSAVFPNMQGGPMEHAIAGKAVAYKEAMQPEFKNYAHQVVQNSKALASGLAAGGLRIVAGGTENHMMLVDTRSIGLTGKDAEAALISAGLVVNKNTIPFDPESPMVTSGIRIGTPALTSREMNVSDMENVAGYILEAVKAHDDESALAKLGTEVAKFASKFPVPGLDS
ncbi:serine hydroxymethyltransferase [Candidatus Lucifugimonas marina]|jgi:glycine hydroxymethyltransferase|uniref:Serine hydroxymethyltransferase n=1 Tax=Candidatus Lucifugimonas marina TaxID=3038979 RepID=A0AAJ5ZJY6_9CHLR|nr:aminotransferase class I/II-fold pyridoxal phosphate-dependent enzyme [SAR202 cluster bacterium JH702]MDG0870257.1 aminotransferase class I/II-fold pyridoxal phosphate-dependent enzyme [SAR202 cluster bacterium JH639]WFG36180.1 aminotransferase class I/II-fold pyridoxal phosphate-dependent enzyme [SAR202 cluster bacterium JH545]WFG40126.1 aminotransferase class I/II-fold pyridoxal phosphate-dependent enzyme [SAR202 cluster bacterium JH1073]